MKLYMVYLGGSAGHSNIEVHDIRFVVGENIDDTIPQLIEQWYGNRKGLHIDCYMEVNHIGGYQVDVINDQLIDANSVKQDEQLYFVNLGGYQPNQFSELHEIGLYVAVSPDDAKQQAKASLFKNVAQGKVQVPHKDNLFDVDDCFPVTLLDGQYKIKLTPKAGGQSIKPDWYGYKVIA